MRLWNWNEAAKAIPYLRSITASIRDHWLDLLHVQRQVRKQETAGGRLKKQQMIALHNHQSERERAQAKFDEALDELTQLNVYLLDPVHGLVHIPFRKNDDLAWYVFDHFSDTGIVGWRYHDDPMDESRPLDNEESLVAVDPRKGEVAA
jgi:hypothetical protein